MTMGCSALRCIMILTLSLLVVPLVAEAQSPTKVYRIGNLNPGSPLLTPHLWEVFRQGLRELGYVEGQNLVIEWRYAEGHDERLPALAAELVQLPVDVMVAVGAAAIRAAQHATRTMPIVMAAAGEDPVRQGFVASLTHP